MTQYHSRERIFPVTPRGLHEGDRERGDGGGEMGAEDDEVGTYAMHQETHQETLQQCLHYNKVGNIMRYRDHSDVGLPGRRG
jgi:hypothetical protein